MIFIQKITNSESTLKFYCRRIEAYLRKNNEF